MNWTVTNWKRSPCGDNHYAMRIHGNPSNVTTTGCLILKRAVYISDTQGSFVHAPSQWQTTLQCTVVSHWLGVYTPIYIYYEIGKTQIREIGNGIWPIVLKYDRFLDSTPSDVPVKFLNKQSFDLIILPNLMNDDKTSHLIYNRPPGSRKSLFSRSKHEGIQKILCKPIHLKRLVPLQ